MLHNQSEIAEFDRQLAGILKGLDTLPNSEVFESVRALMAKLFWHNFTEWNQLGGPWKGHDCVYEAFDMDDADALRGVVRACVRLLKNNGEGDRSGLLATGVAYLKNRGVDDIPLTDSDFTEWLPKGFVAEVIYGISTDTLAARIADGQIKARTRKKLVSVWIDSLPKLKREHERTKALADWHESRKQR